MGVLGMGGSGIPLKSPTPRDDLTLFMLPSLVSFEAFLSRFETLSTLALRANATGSSSSGLKCAPLLAMLSNAIVS